MLSPETRVGTQPGCGVGGGRGSRAPPHGGPRWTLPGLKGTTPEAERGAPQAQLAPVAAPQVGGLSGPGHRRPRLRTRKTRTRTSRKRRRAEPRGAEASVTVGGLARPTWRRPTRLFVPLPLDRWRGWCSVGTVPIRVAGVSAPPPPRQGPAPTPPRARGVGFQLELGQHTTLPTRVWSILLRKAPGHADLGPTQVARLAFHTSLKAVFSNTATF